MPFEEENRNVGPSLQLILNIAMQSISCVAEQKSVLAGPFNLSCLCYCLPSLVQILL